MALGRDSYADRQSGVAADRVEVVMAEISDKPLTARGLAASGASLSEVATELGRAEAAIKARTEPGHMRCLNRRSTRSYGLKLDE
jgi:hypothetical protein